MRLVGAPSLTFLTPMTIPIPPPDPFSDYPLLTILR